MIHLNNNTFKGPGIIRVKKNLWLMPHQDYQDNIQDDEFAFHFKGTPKPEYDDLITIHDIKYRVSEVKQIPHGIVANQGSKNCGILILVLDDTRQEEVFHAPPHPPRKATTKKVRFQEEEKPTKSPIRATTTTIQETPMKKAQQQQPPNISPVVTTSTKKESTPSKKKNE